MSRHAELVEPAAELDVPEGFRAHAIGEVIVLAPQHPERNRRILDIAFHTRRAAPNLCITSDVRISGTGARDKAPDIGILPLDAELRASSALAFVEVVSDSSRETDYVDKPRIYAVAGVPVYLLVDPDRELWTLYTTPTELGYRDTATGSIDTPVEIAGVSVELGN